MVESTREPSPHTLVHRVTPSNSLLLFTPFIGVVLWWCYVIVAVFHSCGLVVKKTLKENSANILAVYTNRLQPLFVSNLYVPVKSSAALPALAVALTTSA